MDADLDLVCDPGDNCPNVVNPNQANGDADGDGDACDPCTGGGAISRARLSFSRVNPPPGDDRLRFQGEVTIPVPHAPHLNPQANGVRVIVLNTAGATVLDATLPGGAYSPFNQTGWSTTPTSWTYRSPGGITRFQLQPRPPVPGRYRFRVQGKYGSYPVGAGDLPLTGVVVLDPPTAETGQCGEAHFAAGACAPNGSATIVNCR